MQTAGLGFLGFVDGATSLWLIALALFVAGFGLGFFEVPNMTTIMAAFPPGRQGAAGGLAFLTRTLGVVAGVALLGELVAARSATVGFLGAFEESLRASAVAVGAAFLFALAARRARR
jgi:MFS family permease